MRWARWLPLALAWGLAACTEAGDSAAPTEPSLGFERLTVDAEGAGPAFATAADMNGDGRLDLVVSRFGRLRDATLPPGEVVIYLQGETVRSWTPQVVVGADAGIYFPNEVVPRDVDADGDLDLVVPAGFLVCPFLPSIGGPCGALAWFEQTPGEWRRHDVVPPGDALFYHAAVFADVDADGRDDLITVGEARAADGTERAEARWFKGVDTADRFDPTPRVIGDGLGSLPTAYDLDGDGDVDLLGAEFFAGHGDSFVWYEQVEAPSLAAPAGRWDRHVIDADSGPAIQLSLIPDLLGDGRVVAVGANHVNTRATPADPWDSAIYLLSPPEDPRAPWSKVRISEGIVSAPGSAAAPQAAPGIFGWGDAEGDGDVDLVVSGDGDPRVFLLEQTSPGRFETHVLDTDLAQAGGMKIVDLDADGHAEILATGYEANAVYLYLAREDGPHPLDPTEPPPPAADSVQFTIDQEGDHAGDLLVALFRIWPPTGPPEGFVRVADAALPLTVELPAVAPGPWQALVVLDVAPFDPMVQGPEDLSVVVPFTAPRAEPVEVRLPAEPPAPPVFQETDVTVNVSFAGEPGGAVVVAAFAELPPTGPPLRFAIVDAVARFPTQVLLEAVPGEACQIMAFLDREPHNPQFPGAEDPRADSDVLPLDGTAAVVELTLPH